MEMTQYVTGVRSIVLVNQSRLMLHGTYQPGATNAIRQDELSSNVATAARLSQPELQSMPTNAKNPHPPVDEFDRGIDSKG